MESPRRYFCQTCKRRPKVEIGVGDLLGKDDAGQFGESVLTIQGLPWGEISFPTFDWCRFGTKSNKISDDNGKHEADKGILTHPPPTGTAPYHGGRAIGAITMAQKDELKKNLKNISGT